MPRFDYNAARAKGHSDDEIAAYLRDQNSRGADLYIDRNDLPQGMSMADDSASLSAGVAERGRMETPGAPSDASASTIHERHANTHTPMNPFGWMMPALATVGGVFGNVPGAMLGAGAGTILDQGLNTALHTPFAPKSALEGDLGILGNTALGGVTEAAPPAVMKAVGRTVGPAAYRMALHVSPELRDAFPNVDIAREAWDQGAPALNREGVKVAKGVIGDRAATMGKMFDIAESRGVPGRVWSEQSRRVPATVPREFTFDLPMTDPQAGASPTVARRVPQPGVEPVSVAQNRMPSQTQEVGGPNQNVWTEYRPAQPAEVQVPRDVLPIEPQTVTHRVMVPGERWERGMAPTPAMLPKLTPNVREALNLPATNRFSAAGNPAPHDLSSHPELAKLVEGLSGNLEGAADKAEAHRIISAWVEENQNKTGLRAIYELAQRAGDSAPAKVWKSPNGQTMTQAASPNSQLVGKNLNRVLVKYLEDQMAKAGAGGFREALGSTQKAIAVSKAVEQARMYGPPRLNAENAGGQVRWGALQNPETLGDVARYIGGKTDKLPANRIANTALRLGKAAAWAPSTAARVAPAVLQRPPKTKRAR